MTALTDAAHRMLSKLHKEGRSDRVRNKNYYDVVFI